MSEEKNIPKHWKIVELKDVVSILGDGLHGTPRYSDVGDYFFINGNNLCDGKIIIKKNTKRVSVEEYNKYKKVLNENTILVSINGTLGNVAFYNNEKVILGKSACYFNVTETIDKNYLKILISGKQFLNYANNEATGSTIKNVSLKSMREFSIPLPPVSEQQAIVSKIEELLSDLENGIQQLLLAQQQLKVYRQSLLKWAFEGKLTNKNVKDGELPEGWKCVKFGELFKNTPQNGLYKPATEYGSGIPILRIDGFYDGIILNNYNYKRVRLTEEETQKYILSIDDIVVNRVNSMSHLGKCGLVKTLREQTVFESNVMKIQIRKEIALAKYITYYLACTKGIKELVKNAKHAVNQASINQTDVANAIIPLSPLIEQQLIVDELESKLTVCDKIEETISQSLQQAETLKQSILKKAFEGRLI